MLLLPTHREALTSNVTVAPRRLSDVRRTNGSRFAPNMRTAQRGRRDRAVSFTSSSGNFATLPALDPDNAHAGTFYGFGHDDLALLADFAC
jgi:hypothetical protein